MQLKISKEKVLEAASKCSQIKQTLEILFPEAFKEEKFIGQIFIPKDNSYILTLDQRMFYKKEYVYKHAFLAHKNCKIISLPYKDKALATSLHPEEIKTFINVEYQGEYYRVLYY